MATKKKKAEEPAAEADELTAAAAAGPEAAEAEPGVDPTPNENYTVGGADLPTPETDADMAKAAREATGRR